MHEGVLRALVWDWSCVGPTRPHVLVVRPPGAPQGALLGGPLRKLGYQVESIAMAVSFGCERTPVAQGDEVPLVPDPSLPDVEVVDEEKVRRLWDTPLHFDDKETVLVTLENVYVESADIIMYTDKWVFASMGTCTNTPLGYNGKPTQNTVIVHEPVINLLHPRLYNFYHFTSECLPRLIVSLEHLLLIGGTALVDSCRLLIPPEYRAPFLYQVLHTLNITFKLEPVEFIPSPNKRYLFKKMYRVDWVQHNQTDLQQNDLWSPYLPSRYAILRARAFVLQRQDARQAAAAENSKNCDTCISACNSGYERCLEVKGLSLTTLPPPCPFLGTTGASNIYTGGAALADGCMPINFAGMRDAIFTSEHPTHAVQPLQLVPGSEQYEALLRQPPPSSLTDPRSPEAIALDNRLRTLTLSPASTEYLSEHSFTTRAFALGVTPIITALQPLLVLPRFGATTRLTVLPPSLPPALPPLPPLVEVSPPVLPLIVYVARRGFRNVVDESILIIKMERHFSMFFNMLMLYKQNERN